jgi:transcriptional regulator with XRE-family HTH domain
MNLREFLDKNNITQSEFARLMGVNRSVICRWLNDKKPSKPSQKSIDSILKACLKIDPKVTYESLFRRGF